MIHLLEIEAFDPALQQVGLLRFGSAGYTTEPTDEPPNIYFEPRISDPGNFQRHLFSSGQTRGAGSVAGGNIKINNADFVLDYFFENDLAFDGRTITIYALDSDRSPWSSRVVAFKGTMEQCESDGRMINLRIRDRLDLLREALQKNVYLGTTIDGTVEVAEGNVDLKDAKKPLLFGTAPLFSPILVDQYDDIYQVNDGPVAIITDVRESGVLLTATQDYPDLAALGAAALTIGHYATCLALGLLRLSETPSGTVTCSASEGATVDDRSAARIVRRLIGNIGVVDESEFDAFHSSEPAECGIWIGTEEVKTLDIIYTILASVRGYLTADRLGVFRIGSLSLPTDPGAVLLDASNILDGDVSFNREATSDDGNGVQARSVTVRYARANTTFSTSDLKDVASTDAFRSFAAQEWRQEKVESESNKIAHPKGPELTFDTCLLSKEAAAAEAAKLMEIYGNRRDLFRIRVASSEAATLDLNQTVTIAMNRYGMAAGVPLRVIGLTDTYSESTTEIEALR